MERIQFTFCVSVFAAMLLSLVMLGCQSGYNGSIDVEKDQIEGTWSLVKALRNGSPTSTMDGAIFNFLDGEFSSNVFGDGRGDYHLSNDSLYTGLRNPEFFEFVSFRDSLMVLRANIRGVSFEFELERKKDEIQ